VGPNETVKRSQIKLTKAEIKPGTESAFEQGIAKAAPIFQRAKGCKGMKLLRSVEQPSHYTLMVTWETVDNHIVDFRNSADFQAYRQCVGEFFAGTPQVGHVQVAVPGF
jgi:heme-degrading monooxygenase HmoA